MAYFQTRQSLFGSILEVLAMEDIGIFYGIWSIYDQLVYYDYFVYFSTFWYVVSRKIWHPFPNPGGIRPHGT
jgi:hypothetical protein